MFLCCEKIVWLPLHGLCTITEKGGKDYRLKY